MPLPGGHLAYTAGRTSWRRSRFRSQAIGRSTWSDLAQARGEAPVIDGRIEESEWAEASKTIGFLDRGNDFALEPRRGYTLLGYDAENLYVAMSTELPPDGKLVAKVRREDGTMHHDDSIELWLDPNRMNREPKQGDQRYYQIVFNSLGTRLDVLCDPEKGVPNSGWTLEGYQFANRLNAEAETWELELAIPWKSPGKDFPQVNGREIGALVVRNWQRPWGQTGYSLAKVAIFLNLQDYAAIRLQPGAPVVREESLGEPFEARFDYRLSIRNPQETEASIKLDASLQAGDMPTRSFSREVTVAGGNQETVAAVTGTESYHRTAATGSGTAGAIM